LGRVTGRGWALFEFERSTLDLGALTGIAFQQNLVTLQERFRAGGKDLQDADQLTAVPDGDDEHGTNPQVAGGGSIHAGVGFGVAAELGLAGAKTGTRDAMASVQGDTKIGGAVSSSGAANHFSITRES
jgi:hypothetical protein